jgi:hypothetical protein
MLYIYMWTYSQLYGISLQLCYFFFNGYGFLHHLRVVGPAPFTKLGDRVQNWSRIVKARLVYPQKSWMKSAQMIKTNLHFSIKFHIYGNRAGFGKGWFLYSRHLGEVCYPQHNINKWWELNGRYQCWIFSNSASFSNGLIYGKLTSH